MFGARNDPMRRGGRLMVGDPWVSPAGTNGRNSRGKLRGAAEQGHFRSDRTRRQKGERLQVKPQGWRDGPRTTTMAAGATGTRGTKVMGFLSHQYTERSSWRPGGSRKIRRFQVCSHTAREAASPRLWGWWGPLLFCPQLAQSRFHVLRQR